MTLRIYSSIGSMIQVNHYGVLYHLIILAFLAIRLVREHLVLLLQLRICLWMLLMRFILMLLRSTEFTITKNLIITVSSESTVYPIPLETNVETTPLEEAAYSILSVSTAQKIPLGTAAAKTPLGITAV